MRFLARILTNKFSQYGPDKNDIVLVRPIYRRQTEWDKTIVVWESKGDPDYGASFEPTDYEVVDAYYLQEAARRLWNECFRKPWFLGVGVANQRLVVCHEASFPGQLPGTTFLNCPIELRPECSFFIPAVLEESVS